MATAYPTPPGDGMQPVVDAVKSLRTQTRALQRPGGTRLAGLVAQVQAAIANINASVATAFAALVAGGFSTPGSIHAAGALTGDTGVNSVGVYNNLLTTAYRVQYVNSAGPMGYVPSSRRFKRDIATAPDIRESLLAMRIVTFRYNAAVEELGDDADVEWGVIAEELHDLGLTWAVDYDDEGLPFGVKYERLVLAVVPVVQDHERRMRAAGI